MRSTSRFVCQQCGYISTEWMGRCPECGQWSSLVEEIASEPLKKGMQNGQVVGAVIPKKLSEIKSSQSKRTLTGFEELDRVLGGGIVEGSVTLLSGDPGIGKSTLLLQVALHLAGKKALYISGEESLQQLKLRADRMLHKSSPNLFFLAETSLDYIIGAIEKVTPPFVVIDSIQTLTTSRLTGSSGSVGQIRECTQELIQLAKKKGISLMIIGHVTKEGTIAGPQVLAHLVDTVLFLEGERFKAIRVLRSLKNRFGPVDEVGVFAFAEAGFADVKNPSELFLSKELNSPPGSVVVSTIEGTRPLLVEIQALVVPTKLPYPRHVVSGVTPSRVEILCAVLQKQAGLPVDRFDVFINVAGGLRLSEPAVDLGICLAIASSIKNVAMGKTVAIGEVGLLGEIRDVQGLEKREKEARKLGFSRIFSSRKYRSVREVIERHMSYVKKEN